MTIMGSINQAANMRATAAANAENMRKTAEINKQQADFVAGQEQAAGQHAALAERRKAALLLSRAHAVSAAGGGGPLDETLMKGIIGEGERNAGFATYNAEERASGLRYKGAVGEYEANARGIQGIKEANASADATIMGGLAKGAMGFASLAPGAAPTMESLGGQYNSYTYYG